MSTAFTHTTVLLEETVAQLPLATGKSSWMEQWAAGGIVNGYYSVHRQN